MLLPGAYAIGHTFVEVGRAHQDLQHSCSHQGSENKESPARLARPWRRRPVALVFFEGPYSYRFNGFLCSPVGFEPILPAQVSRASIAGLRQPLNISRHIVRNGSASDRNKGTARRYGSRGVRRNSRSTDHTAVEQGALRDSGPWDATPLA